MVVRRTWRIVWHLKVECQRTTRALFADAVSDRGDARPFQRQVLSAVALTALTVAIDTWAASDGAEDLPALVDPAFEAL